MLDSKTPWLHGIKNGTGSDSPTWKGDTRPRPLGDTWTKAALVVHLRRTGLIKQQPYLIPNRALRLPTATRGST